MLFCTNLKEKRSWEGWLAKYCRGGEGKKSIRRQTRPGKQFSWSLMMMDQKPSIWQVKESMCHRISIARKNSVVRLPASIWQRLLKKIEVYFIREEQIKTVKFVSSCEKFKLWDFVKVIFQKREMLMLIPILASVSSSDYLVTLITR